jgi:coenzyme PQQ precursor peptide PqqA
MQWTKPEFKEISLAMEVTAYVNTDASDPITHGASEVAHRLNDEVDERALSLSAV